MSMQRFVVMGPSLQRMLLSKHTRMVTATATNAGSPGYDQLVAPELGCGSQQKKYYSVALVVPEDSQLSE
jgi:hypothetical protein